MKVELVLPAMPSWQVGEGSSVPPLGLMYIAGVLNEAGHEVQITDQQGEDLSDEKLKEKIKKFDPGVIGYTTYTHFGRRAIKIADYIHEAINPNVITIFGGFFATMNPKEILGTSKSVDFCVRGEGEFTALELINALEKNQDISKIRGITYKENGIIKATPDRPIIKDIDALPIPDRNLVKGNHYGNYANMSIEKFTSLGTSRGCPFQCRFCLTTQWHKNIWRKRDFRKVADEFEYLHDLGYKNALIVDDNINVSPKHVNRLSHELRKRKLDLNWFCEGRVGSGTAQMYNEMRRAGCKLIFLGIESGNQRILDYFDKRATVEQARNTVKAIRKANIDMITATFIVGSPTETLQEVHNTINFALKLDIDIPLFGILNVFEGTALWDEYLKQGHINPEEDWGKAIPVCDFHPDCLPRDTLVKLINRGYKKLLNSKKWVLKVMLRALKSRFRLKMYLKNLDKRHTIKQRFRFADISQLDLYLEDKEEN
ncbi:MAG: cobalamin B12-binding domain-containing protein [Candidatus Helarchaeota archaeon]|nr:cobalamin B12-binding domain-containing protein [Candidatus Helarchaeota archaeon]